MANDPIRPDSIHSATPAGSSSTPGRATPGAGAVFRALLEKLEGHARALREEGARLEDPSELAGAVDRARASIDDADSLGRERVEAFRAARQRAESEGGAR